MQILPNTTSGTDSMRRFYLALGALDSLAQRAGAQSPSSCVRRLDLIAFAARVSRDELDHSWRSAVVHGADPDDALTRAEERLTVLDRALCAALARNAGNVLAPPVNQLRLHEMLRSLVRAYGYRPELVHEEFPPNQVPWTPLPFAAEVVHWLVDLGSDWLKKSIPIEAKQPGFISKHLTLVQGVAGSWKDGRLESVKDSYELAPNEVATKAPDFFPALTAAGLPSALVMKAAPSWQFWYSVGALAIHFDALGGAPTLAELWEESFSESISELPQTVRGAATAVVHGVGGMIGSLPWKPILLTGGGLVLSAIVLPAILRRGHE